MRGTLYISASAFYAYPEILSLVVSQGHCFVGKEVTTKEDRFASFRAFEGYCSEWDTPAAKWFAHFKEPVTGLAFLGWEKGK